MSTAALFGESISDADDRAGMNKTSKKAATITDEHKEESRRLKEIWNRAPHASQAAFGEEYGIGGQSAVANFLNGGTALNLKAARGFARGLGCEISAFSPRLAAIASDLGSLASTAGADSIVGRAPGADEIRMALSVLTTALGRADRLTAAQVKPLFSMLLETPAADSGTIAQRIAELLSPASAKEVPPEDPKSQASGEVDVIINRGQENGTSTRVPKRERSAGGG